MIILLRDEMQGDHSETECCAIKTRHAEVFAAVTEVIYPYDGDIAYIDIQPENGDVSFRWDREIYGFCIMYDDDREDALRYEFPKCKWFIN
jgi:hypothetical protein